MVRVNVFGHSSSYYLACALSGLRGLSDRVRMELKNMGSVQYDIFDNVILRDAFEEEMAESKAETGRLAIDILCSHD